jgi:hypothetical protein
MIRPSGAPPKVISAPARSSNRGGIRRYGASRASISASGSGRSA